METPPPPSLICPRLPLAAVAGASGFVGTNLRQSLADLFRWRALTRSATVAEEASDADGTEWRQCDLFSLRKVEEAVAGAQLGVYLVHSMLPSSRLVQGSFRDLDVLLADNFIRAAEAAGVEHVIYLGGLIPKDTSRLSPHLASRLEVEDMLRSRGIPVTVLRAGLICGPGGSSMKMLINLVQRLPVMVMPQWTQSMTQSTDIRDVVRAFRKVMTDKSLWGGTYDLGGHPPVTYRTMILKTAEILGKKPLTLDVPVNLVGLSTGWVALVTDTPQALVAPLLESLQHSLSARPNPLQQALVDDSPGCIPFEQSVRESLDTLGNALPNPRSRTLPRDIERIREQRRVRSVQRMPLPKGWNAARVASEYGAWLSRSWIIKVTHEESGRICFYWHFPQLLLLELVPTPRSLKTPRRRAFFISGGLLSRKVDPPGRFEFRIFEASACVICAIHDFAPRLPWFIYASTQALIHLLVMAAFSRHLGQIVK